MLLPTRLRKLWDCNQLKIEHSSLMNKILNTTLAAILFCTAASAADIIVKVEYNGNSAVVTIPTEASAYVNNLNGESSHVKLLQTSMVSSTSPANTRPHFN